MTAANDDFLSREEVAVLKDAIGTDRRRSPFQNVTFANTVRPRWPMFARLADLGLLAEDHAASYRRLRCFRVTKAGFNAVGVIRPRKDLLDKVPRVVAPLPLAAE